MLMRGAISRLTSRHISYLVVLCILLQLQFVLAKDICWQVIATQVQQYVLEGRSFSIDEISDTVSKVSSPGAPRALKFGHQLDA